MLPLFPLPRRSGFFFASFFLEVVAMDEERIQALQEILDRVWDELHEGVDSLPEATG